MKILRIVSYVAAVCAALMVGTLFGLRVERAAQADEAVYQASLEQGFRTIAVVTLDEGISADGANTNYSSPLLASMDSAFRLTSYSQAEQGLSDGAYDAMVVIPADFSQKVESVNTTNPQKITVDYHINEHLPESAYIETVQLIEKFQIDLDQKLSYAFLSSVYSELHDAQDKTGKLLSNDAKDLGAIEGVSAYNFTQNIQLGDMPQAKLEVGILDISDFNKTVGASVQEINAVYAGIAGNMAGDYEQATQTVQTTIDIASAELDSIENQSNQYMIDWYNAAEAWRLSQVNYEQALRAAMDDVEASLSNMDVWLHGTEAAGGAEDWYDEASLWWTMQGNDQGGEGAPTSLDAASNNISGWYANVDGWYQADDWDSDPPPIDISLKDWYDAAVVWQSENAGFTSDIALTESVGNALADDLYLAACALRELCSLDTDSPPNPGDITDWHKAAVDWYDAALLGSAANLGQPPDPSGYNILIDTDPVKTSLSEAQATADGYKPASYFTKDSLEAAQDAAGAIKTSAASTLKLLGETQAENTKQISSAYQAYNKYVSDLRQSVYDAYANELLQVNEAKGLFVNIGKETSKENISLIGEFSGKMPNSRMGEAVNTAVVEFSTAPISFVKADTRGALPVAYTSKGDDLFRLILYICLGAIVLSLIVRAARRSRKEPEIR